MLKPRIIILGAGYAAIRVVRSLKKQIEQNELEVLVISRNNHHTFHGFVSEMLTGRISPHLITSPSRRIFKPATLILAEIQRIDLEAKTVSIRRDFDNKISTLSYDHLVISLGSVTAHTQYPGMAKHGFDLKTYETCLELRHHLMNIIELAANETDPEERKRLLTFVVVGGGYAGSEVSGELADFQSLLRKNEFKHIPEEDFHVILIHSGEEILPDYSHGPGANGYGKGHPKQVVYAAKHLEQRLGVEVRRNCRVVAVTADEVLLDSGERIATRTVIPTVGIQSPPLVNELPLEREPRLGRILVQQTLQVPGYDSVWAVGDCAAVPHPEAGFCPPVGVYATFGGGELGRNILRQERNEELVDFVHPGLGQAVSLGRRTVAGEIWGLYTRGFLGWLIAWRMGLIYFIPTMDRRLRLLADWLIWPFTGRDIVGANPERTSQHTIHRLHFEAGDVISHENCQAFYVILHGRIQNTQTGQELQRGDSFTNGAVHQAITPVKIARMSFDQARELRSIFQTLTPVKEL